MCTSREMGGRDRRISRILGASSPSICNSMQQETMCQPRWKAGTNVGGCPSPFHVVPGAFHFTQAPYTQSKATPLAVKEQTVESARFLWPLLFSRLFEVTTLSGKSTRCCVVGEDRKLLSGGQHGLHSGLPSGQAPAFPRHS